MIEGDARKGFYVLDKKPGKAPKIIGGPYSKEMAKIKQVQYYKHVRDKTPSGNGTKPNGVGRCKECGGVMEFDGGCRVCRGCGYSPC